MSASFGGGEVSPGAIVGFANQQASAANGFLIRLALLSQNLVPPIINPVFPEPQASPLIQTVTPPTVEEIVWVAPALPTAFNETLTVDDILPATFEDQPPDLIFGTVPTFSETAPDAPGIDITFEMPELSLNLPTAPALLGINISPFAGLDLPPALDLVVPELSISPPSIREYTPQTTYVSDMLTNLQTRLTAYLAGGTGLDPAVENAIWDRGREREARAGRDALAELDRMEEMGFALPPGVYVDGRIKIGTETDYANRGHSREVMIKAAELEQENIKTALTVATQLESYMISYTNSVEQRIFESCKYATEAGVAIYNARVQAYAAFLEAFKARVNIYEAQIRAELAKVEAYKALMSAEQTKAEVNRALVESYRVQVEAAMSGVEIFKARIGAIQAKADIEKTKIEIFGEQVRAYTAKVNAYTAGVEGFRATIQAEASKQEAFKSRVQVYAARVDAAARLIEARIGAFKSRIEAKGLEYDGYKATIGAESARVSAIAEVNKSRSETYKAEVTGVASYNEVLTKQWEAAIENAGRVAEIGVSAAKANAELYITSRQLAVEAAKVGATVSAQLGAAALNAVNWSNSFSMSIGQSTSTSDSTQTSTSHSDSNNQNYNYSV